MSKTFVAAVLFAVVFASSPAYALPSYIVTLTNGNVLEVNSYRLDKEKLYVKYPVGEGAFPVRQVVSIKSGDGSLVFLQAEGVFIPQAAPAATRPAGSANEAANARPGGRRLSSHDDLDERPRTARDRGRSVDGPLEVQPAPAGDSGFGSDPLTSSVVDQSFRAASDEDRARVEKVLQKMFDADERNSGNEGERDE